MTRSWPVAIIAALAAASSSAASQRSRDVGRSIDGSGVDLSVDPFVGRDLFLINEDANPLRYYVERGARFGDRIAFRTSPDTLRVVSLKQPSSRDYPIPDGCAARDVAGRDVLLQCADRSLRDLHLDTGAITHFPQPATSDFQAVALGRYWVLGRSCDTEGSSPACSFQHLNRSHQETIPSLTPRDIDTVGLRPLRAENAGRMYLYLQGRPDRLPVRRKGRASRSIRCRG